LLRIRESLECLQVQWEHHEEWSALLAKYSGITLKDILADRYQLEDRIRVERDTLNSKLRKCLGSNEVLEELDRKVQTFEKYMPIVGGLSSELSEGHWEEINDLARKSCGSVALDLRKLDVLTLEDMTASCLGELGEEFQDIFVKAQNEIKLQS
jgi:hypothetical protein